jgi:transcriptional regulator with XRE-family HTH domain
MKVGTPNFIGARLTQAREARGLSQVELAEIIGVKRQVVSAYEMAIPGDSTSGNTPSPEVFHKLTNLLDRPSRFFLIPSAVQAVQNAPFRKKKSSVKRRENRSRILANWASEIINLLESFVIFPELDIPKPLENTDPNSISTQEIEQKAIELREKLELKPFEPIKHLIPHLESRGILFFEFDFGVSDIEGFAHLDTKRPKIVLNKQLTNSCRRITTF